MPVKKRPSAQGKQVATSAAAKPAKSSSSSSSSSSSPPSTSPSRGGSEGKADQEEEKAEQSPAGEEEKAGGGREDRTGSGEPGATVDGQTLSEVFEETLDKDAEQLARKELAAGECMEEPVHRAGQEEAAQGQGQREAASIPDTPYFPSGGSGHGPDMAGRIDSPRSEAGAEDGEEDSQDAANCEWPLELLDTFEFPSMPHFTNSEFFNYELEGQISKGVYGRVYAARHHSSNHRYAIKVCKAAEAAEINALVRCQGPNIIRIYDAWVVNEIWKLIIDIAIEACRKYSIV